MHRPGHGFCPLGKHIKVLGWWTLMVPDRGTCTATPHSPAPHANACDFLGVFSGSQNPFRSALGGRACSPLLELPAEIHGECPVTHHYGHPPPAFSVCTAPWGFLMSPSKFSTALMYLLHCLDIPGPGLEGVGSIGWVHPFGPTERRNRARTSKTWCLGTEAAAPAIDQSPGVMPMRKPVTWLKTRIF